MEGIGEKIQGVVWKRLINHQKLKEMENIQKLRSLISEEPELLNQVAHKETLLSLVKFLMDENDGKSFGKINLQDGKAELHETLSVDIERAKKISTTINELIGPDNLNFKNEMEIIHEQCSTTEELMFFCFASGSRYERGRSPLSGLLGMLGK